MKQSKQSKPRASKKGCEDKHYETVVEAVHEPVLEQYKVIIHDEECKKLIEERKIEEPVELVVEPEEVQMLLEEPAPEAEPVVEEYVAKYSDCGHKVLNPQTKRYVRCDGPIARKLNFIR